MAVRDRLRRVGDVFIERLIASLRRIEARAKLRAAERTAAPARDDVPALLPNLPSLADVLRGR